MNANDARIVRVFTAQFDGTVEDNTPNANAAVPDQFDLILQAEVGAVLEDEPASPSHVPALPYTQAVLNETLRLYPPAYVTGREAIRDTTCSSWRLSSLFSGRSGGRGGPA